MGRRILVWLVFALVVMSLAIILDSECRADLRINLVTRLDEYCDDVSNRKMSAANKLVILEAVGRELGRLGFVLKRDSIITAKNTEMYSAKYNFAGALNAAYHKEGASRTVVRVVPRDSVFLAPNSPSRGITFIFVEDAANYGVDPLPIGEDTFIVIYHAYPDTLTGDSTEWDIPDEYEDAALRLAASRVLMKIPTMWATQKSELYRKGAWEELGILATPQGQTRQVGDSP